MTNMPTTEIQEIKEKLANAIFQDHEGNIEHVDMQKHQVLSLIDYAYTLGHRAAIEAVEKELDKIDDANSCHDCKSVYFAIENARKVLSSLKESDNGSAQEK